MNNLLDERIASPVLQPYTAAAAASPVKGPTEEATQRYRHAILNGGDGTAQMQAAWRTAFEVRADLATLSRRKQAVWTLENEVPKLQSKIPALRAEYEEAKAAAERPLELFATVKELAEYLETEIAHGAAKIVTLLDLSAAAEVFAKRSTAAKYDRVVQAGETVERCRDQALNVLRETLSPAVSAESSNVPAKIVFLRTRIVARGELVNIESRIAACEAQCEKLAASDRQGNAYRAERSRLDSLRRLAGQRDQAIKDNEEDEKEIAKLEGRLKAAHAKLMDPAAMKWAGM